MSFNAKLFIGLVVLIIIGCKEKTKKQEFTQDKLSHNKECVENKTLIINSIKEPCLPPDTIFKQWKNDTKDFSARVISICLADYAVKDTFENTEFDWDVVENSNYKYLIKLSYFDSTSDKEYTLTKEILANKIDENIYSRRVLDRIKILDFDNKDLSITLTGLFRNPEVDSGLLVTFRVSFDAGIKLMRVENPYEG